MDRNFSIKELPIGGVYEIIPFVSNDARGCFIKDYSQQFMQDNGIKFELKEVFYTISKPATIRAIHFQNTKQQAKLVRVIKGRILDICVDLRADSSSYGKWIGLELSDKNQKELLIPKGCGHGYIVFEESIVSYKCDEKFYAEYDDGIIWNDKTLNIDWQIEQFNEIIISDKDKQLQTFEEFSKKQAKA
jgi:dTDP-4-dehydrorhamnose 3,5-epimerase